MLRQDFWSRFFRRFGWGYDPDGIAFMHHGDEIIYLWWWKRINKSFKFYSIGFNCPFRSLKQIDDLWEQYFKDMST
jgi:hypothetical protein